MYAVSKTVRRLEQEREHDEELDRLMRKLDSQIWSDNEKCPMSMPDPECYEDFVGGGLLRSAGGYVAFINMRRGGERVAGDERILGSGEFVEQVFEKAEVKEEDRSRKRRKWTAKQVIERAAKCIGIEVKDVIGNGKRPRQSKARALVCYWLVDEMGIPEVEVAHDLGITQPAVSKAVTRGREVALAEHLRLER